MNLIFIAIYLIFVMLICDNLQDQVDSNTAYYLLNFTKFICLIIFSIIGVTEIYEYLR